MARSSAFLVALFLALGTAHDARPAMLYWEGSLTIEIERRSSFFATGTGLSTVNGSSGLGHLSTLRLAGGISPSPQVLSVSDPYVPTAASVVISVSPQTGTLAPISGGGPLTQNSMPLAGT